jgi:hypothetical protein
MTFQANSAFETMKKYQITFESSFKRLSEVEQLLDHQSFPKFSNRVNTSSEIPVNSLVSTFLMSVESVYKILLVCSTQC